jgi:hypothetical protein
MVDARRFFDTFQSCVSDDYPGIHDWARQHLPLIVWDYNYDPSLPDSEENMRIVLITMQIRSPVMELVILGILVRPAGSGKTDAELYCDVESEGKRNRLDICTNGRSCKASSGERRFSRESHQEDTI